MTINTEELEPFQIITLAVAQAADGLSMGHVAIVANEVLCCLSDAGLEITRAPSPVNKELLEALEGLLRDYDEERAVIDVDPSPSCFECTLGTVPDRLNKGPCAYHIARAAIQSAQESKT